MLRNLWLRNSWLKNPHILLGAALYLFCCAGCSQKNDVVYSNTPGDTVSVIENVPFIKQKDDFCGPAAMVSVMAHYGNTLGQDEVAGEVYTPALNGALISDMENFARDEGFQSRTENGSLQSLKALIDEGVPVILLVDRGKWRVSVPHYYVVYGYSSSRDTFVLHTGFEGGRKIESSKLDSEWERMNRLMLVIKK